MERWHGEGFIKFEYPGKYPAHVKVDGNRRILVAKESDQVVKATFTDLLVENEKEKLAESPDLTLYNSLTLAKQLAKKGTEIL